jgi:hypothetical protein
LLELAAPHVDVVLVPEEDVPGLDHERRGRQGQGSSPLAVPTTS